MLKKKNKDIDIDMPVSSSAIKLKPEDDIMVIGIDEAGDTQLTEEDRQIELQLLERINIMRKSMLRHTRSWPLVPDGKQSVVKAKALQQKPDDREVAAELISIASALATQSEKSIGEKAYPPVQLHQAALELEEKVRELLDDPPDMKEFNDVSVARRPPDPQTTKSKLSEPVLRKATPKVLYNWKADRAPATSYSSFGSPTVVLHNDVLLWADRDAAYDPKSKTRRPGTPRFTGTLIAYAVEDGKELWSCPTGETFHAPFEVFVMEDLVWTGGVSKPDEPGLTEGRDYRTGKVVRTRPPSPDLYQITGHASCYRNKATERFLLMNRAGIDFIDVNEGKAYSNHFARGAGQRIRLHDASLLQLLHLCQA